MSLSGDAGRRESTNKIFFASVSVVPFRMFVCFFAFYRLSPLSKSHLLNCFVMGLCGGAVQPRVFPSSAIYSRTSQLSTSIRIFSGRPMPPDNATPQSHDDGSD